MRLIQVSGQAGLKQIMQEIGVDPCGIKIMAPKGVLCLVRMDAISNITANILKQEMLSLGADAAIARGALTGKVKKTGCLLIGNLAQFRGLCEKLRKQPFGLNNLGKDLSLALSNYQKDKFTIDLGRHKLNLGSRVHLSGIVNLTPDSFSGDGLSGKWQMANGKWQIPKIIEYAQKIVEDGADIIDVGGESSRPGGKPVAIKEELSRVIPAIKALSKKIKVPLSIDTCKPEVAQQALDNGAAIVNDITGLKDAGMRKAVAKYKAAAVIMHMQGSPATMQDSPSYKFLINEIMGYLDNRIKLAVEAGVDLEKIIIDPGIGFGKALEHNLEILKNLREFKVLGRPILAGPSRKSFIGKILGVKPEERIFGTVSSCLSAARNGASILRVHDVKEVKQALKVMEAIDHA